MNERGGHIILAYLSRVLNNICYVNPSAGYYLNFVLIFDEKGAVYYV